MNTEILIQKRPLAVITGASRGIGAAIAARFLLGGFDLVLCSLDEQRLKNKALELANQSQDEQGSVRFFAADLSTVSGAKELGSFVLERGGCPDVLVNNAGLFLPGQISTEADDTFEKLMNANIGSAYHLSRALLPAMKAAKKGHIFNICSTASQMAYLNGGSYCISKHALLGFNRTLREELKPDGIRVTAVLPGATLTDSWAESGLPDERFMPAQDVAQAVWDAWAMSERTVIEQIVMRPQLGDI